MQVMHLCTFYIYACSDFHCSSVLCSLEPSFHCPIKYLHFRTKNHFDRVCLNPASVCDTIQLHWLFFHWMFTSGKITSLVIYPADSKMSAHVYLCTVLGSKICIMAIQIRFCLHNINVIVFGCIFILRYSTTAVQHLRRVRS